MIQFTNLIRNIKFVFYLTASLRTLLGYKEPLLRKDSGLANASLTILETHDFETFTLDTWNDTSYQ